MTDIQIFNNPQFGEVRAVTIDNEPWFVGKDVAERLGYSNARDALARHVFWDKTHTLDGAALELHRCIATIWKWNGEFVRAVEKELDLP